MSAIVERLAAIRLVPVVELETAEQAVPLGRALIAGGLPCMEVTFRTGAAADGIRALAAACPEILVGAGTVLTTAQADAAREAGASFLVAPGFNPVIAAHASSIGLQMFPGVCTPTEIEAALGVGLDTLKFFPAEVAGGVAFLKGVAAVYPTVRFIPTGGIGPGNLAGYLALRTVLACGGSWMVNRQLIAAGRFDRITTLAREAVVIAAGSSL